MSAWVRSVGFLPGESLSSWLIRAALAQGCDPLTLTGVIWPRYRVWTLDVDRGVESDKLASLSVASGITAAVFENSFIRKDGEKIAGHPLGVAGTWPWILALGFRNRNRSAGMQYCPSCFAEDADPYFRREWRFAWQTSCSQHHIRLLDRCWFCDALITPHKLVAEDAHLDKCPHCKADLCNAKRIAIHRSTQAFQEQADATLAAGDGSYAGKIFPACDWFVLARFWVDVMRCAARNESSGLSVALQNLQLPIPLNLFPLFSVQLECLPPEAREVLFANAFHLMSLSQSDIHRSLKNAHVTKKGLQSNSHDLPAVLSDILIDMKVIRRIRKKRSASTTSHRSPRTVKMMWARLLRKMRVNPHE